MLTRTVRFQLLAFVVIAVVGVGYLAIRYVGVLTAFGASGYTVRMDLPQTGGIFTNAEVDYRGVPVGRVGDLRLTATGIQIDLDITSDTRIPDAVRAVVADRSVIGEQYVDLRPLRATGPYLHNGSLIEQRQTQLPPPVQDLLLSSESLVHSVPIGSLRTVVNELYLATDNLGPASRQLIDDSRAFFTTADENLPTTVELIDSSRTVLATQNATSQQITDFSRNLVLIGQQLQASDGDISALLARTAPSVSQITGLTTQIRGSLGGLLSNLLTTSAVFYANKDALREVLVQLPVAVSIGGSVITPQGINVGLVPTFFDPLPCTSGYGGTHVRAGTDTAGDPPLNTSAACTTPPAGGEIRGSANAPRAGK